MSQRLLDELDSFSPLRNAVKRAAEHHNEWAGIPIPLPDQKLIIEPTYPFKSLGDIDGEEEKEGEKIKVRNIFWSHKWRCRIAIFEDENGKIGWAPLIGTANTATALVLTIGASFAWGIEQEARAIDLLATLLTHVRFKQYMLTGMFIETSKKSGVTYIFRRLRPTIATRGNGDRVDVLCCLCMHPIAYYDGSWGGAMCPTDDVIAHLMLMRADEKMFWRRCNQHPASDPGGGI